jgi:Acetyltransferase (GNAT) domain
MRTIDRPDFLTLPDDVAALFARTRRDSFFNCPEWYDVVAKSGLDAGSQVRLYASSDAALVACVAAPVRPREIRGCCNMYTIEHAILADTPDHARAFMTEFARECSHMDGLLIPGLDPASPQFGAACAGLKDAGFVVKPHFSWGIWFEAIVSGFEGYFDARPSVLKNTWRRKLAVAEKSARVAFRTGDDIDIERFISSYDEVYQRSWKEPEPFPGFMSALMRTAAKLDALRYGVLEADGQPVAVQFWIVWGERAIIYKLAYDEKWSKFSPGTLLTMHMAKHVLQRDSVREINFGRGDDAYKKLWMSERRERWGIEAANPKTVRGLSRTVRLKAALARDLLAGRRGPP